MNPSQYLLMILAAATFGCATAEIEKFDLRTAAGWLVVDFNGGKVEGATVSAKNSGVIFQYKRNVLSPLAHTALLADLERITLTLQSRQSATFMLAAEDRDGAAFHFPFELKAGVQTVIKAVPGDFKLNDDSKVRKPKLDPSRLGLGYVLLDLGPLLGGTGQNELLVSSVEIERAELPKKKGTLEVSEATTIAASGAREGDIRITRGGRLKITAPRFALQGDIFVEDGVLEIDGSIFSVAQRFNHERTIALTGRSRLIVRNSHIVNTYPIGIYVGPGCQYAVDTSEFHGGTTVDVPAGSRVTLNQAKAPGEFIISPGSEVSVSDSHFVLLWLTLGDKAKGKLSLPKEDRIEQWTSGHGLSVSVKNCEHILWGVISAPGSDITIEDSHLLAAGLLFIGDAKVSFKDIHNKMETRFFDASGTDRKIRFANTKVDAWNFYAEGNSHVTLENCTFGETLGIRGGAVTVRNSTCDGTGGYIGSDGTSVLKFSNCKLDCRVIAREKSTMILEDCTVSGDIQAAGTATVKLLTTKTSGRVDKDAGATVIRE